MCDRPAGVPANRSRWVGYPDGSIAPFQDGAGVLPASKGARTFVYDPDSPEWDLDEDDDDVRTYSVEVLRDLGYRVVEAHDGPSALRLLEPPPVESSRRPARSLSAHRLGRGPTYAMGWLVTNRDWGGGMVLTRIVGLYTNRGKADEQPLVTESNGRSTGLTGSEEIYG